MTARLPIDRNQMGFMFQDQISRSSHYEHCRDNLQYEDVIMDYGVSDYVEETLDVSSVTVLDQALAYLQGVRKEVEQCPAVVFKEAPVPSIPRIQVEGSVEDDFSVSCERSWIEHVLVQFQEMRNRVPKQQTSSNIFIPEQDEDEEELNNESDEESDICTITEDPELEEVPAVIMKTIQTEIAPRYETEHSSDWWQQFLGYSDSKEAPCLCTATLNILTDKQLLDLIFWHSQWWISLPPQYESQCLWLYALLVHLDDRLVADEIFPLRQFGRSAVQLLKAWNQTEQVDKSLLYRSVQVLLVILVNHFGQRDLCRSLSLL